MRPFSSPEPLRDEWREPPRLSFVSLSFVESLEKADKELAPRDRTAGAALEP